MYKLLNVDVKQSWLECRCLFRMMCFILFAQLSRHDGSEDIPFSPLITDEGG